MNVGVCVCVSVDYDMYMFFLCVSVINICMGACLRVYSVNVGISVYVCVV